jgi:hypothetical protein
VQVLRQPISADKGFGMGVFAWHII